MCSEHIENCIQKQTELYYFSAEDAADELEGVMQILRVPKYEI